MKRGSRFTVVNPYMVKTRSHRNEQIRLKIDGVTSNFTTHGGSHIYGLPYPSANSLDPMDHFCTFDVSNIIPKNMHYFPYMNFKPILMYIRGYDP